MPSLAHIAPGTLKLYKLRGKACPHWKYHSALWGIGSLPGLCISREDAGEVCWEVCWQDPNPRISKMMQYEYVGEEVGSKLHGQRFATRGEALQAVEMVLRLIGAEGWS